MSTEATSPSSDKIEAAAADAARRVVDADGGERKKISTDERIERIGQRIRNRARESGTPGYKDDSISGGMARLRVEEDDGNDYNTRWPTNGGIQLEIKGSGGNKFEGDEALNHPLVIDSREGRGKDIPDIIENSAEVNISVDPTIQIGQRRDSANELRTVGFVGDKSVIHESHDKQGNQVVLQSPSDRLGEKNIRKAAAQHFGKQRGHIAKENIKKAEEKSAEEALAKAMIDRQVDDILKGKDS